MMGNWLLPDGTFLDIGDRDHRVVGNFCPSDDWHEFLKEGALSLFYDYKARYLWIRTAGINLAQRMKFESLFADGLLRVTEMRVEQFEFSDNGFHRETMEMGDEGMIKLYLTDPIGFQIALSEQEAE